MNVFSGTIYLVRVTFNVNGTIFAMSDADMQVAIRYLTMASVPIVNYARQYGNAGLTVNQNYLAMTTNRTDTSYGDDELKSWAEQVWADNNLPANSCIAFLNPIGIDIKGSDSRSSGTGGAHSYTDGRPYLFIHTEGSLVSVQDMEWHFAGRLSHETAEMTVNPIGNNPEVCDACGPNFNSTYLAYFDTSGAYIETSQTPPYNVAFAFGFYINAIVQPAYAKQQKAPAAACCYIPPGYVRGQLSFGAAIEVNGWENDGCSNRFQLLGATIEANAVTKSLNAPFQIENVVFQWGHPVGAQIVGSSDTQSVTLKLTTAGVVTVSVTIAMQDSFSTVSHQATLMISVLSPAEAATWRSLCVLRNQLRFVPQPIWIGDPALKQIGPFTPEKLNGLRETVPLIGRATQALHEQLATIDRT